MQLRHLKTLMPPADGMCRVTAICFSPNNVRLAVVTVDKVVHLFDENGERRDKFATKPGDKVREGRARGPAGAAPPSGLPLHGWLQMGPKAYIVTGMAFSPDSTRLAVAQSDNIVFVYKLGADWTGKAGEGEALP